MSGPDTIVAPATPPGTSALAIVRVSGPLCKSLRLSLFGEATGPARMLVRGTYRALAGNPLDDMLHVLFEGPNSSTGEDVLELHLHGNPVIVGLVVHDLVARGCRPAEAGEFTRRAFLNGRMSLEAAEAVADLLSARSEHALATALRQMGGELGRRVDSLAAELHELVAEVEAYLDFPEDDLPVESLDLEASLAPLLEKLRVLRSGAAARERQQEGWRVVLVGTPNAGKSTLFNLLAGEDRALVDHEPGTTRDTVEVLVPMAGSLVRLVDTAGIREDAGRVEALGIRRTINEMERADLLLLLAPSDLPYPAKTPDADRTWIVRSKADLLPHPSWAVRDPGMGTLSVSTKEALGGERLRRALEAWVRRQEPDSDVLLVSARHAAILQDAEGLLAEALTVHRAAGPQEQVAHALRAAWAELGRITGRTDPESLLDTIFSRFCIGK